MDLSVIVPLYNEEENVGLLCAAIVDALADSGAEYELILVDDGSVDATFERARELAQVNKAIRVIRLRGNCGQTPAMVAGIEHARGRTLVTLDGDLQNDPRDIPAFLAKIDEGYDMVVGWRHERKDFLISRRIPSRIANWLIGKVTGVPIKDNGCSLKAFRSDLIKQVPLYSEMHRFIPAMASLMGPRLIELKVRHHARRFGKSKYGLSRTYRVLLDLLIVKSIIGFASRPLTWFVLPAVPALIVSLTFLALSVSDMFAQPSGFSIPFAGTGLLFAALSFFLIMTGTVAELVYRAGDVRVERLSALAARRLPFEPTKSESP